ncbi:hypothetical protein BGY98DRAFT_234638 [Russula aff. rugulosa BPL654]|nr:hypothetical protein BGY98DRAFT_234638 [Russula aff. rugulosa BPL654]
MMLIEVCVRAIQQILCAAPSIKEHAKSVYLRQNLRTIKDCTRKQKEEKEVGGGNHNAHSPDATEYVRVHRATITDPGDDAGKAGTVRAPAADAEGPEARRRSPHHRSTSRASESLTSGVEYPFRRYCGYLAHQSIIHSLLCSFLATSSLGSSFFIIVVLFCLMTTHFFFFALFVLIAYTLADVFGQVMTKCGNYSATLHLVFRLSTWTYQ